MSDDDFLDDDLDPAIFNVPVEYNEIVPKVSKTAHRIDLENLKTYIYPTNLQVRDYQYNIVNRALFHNVLVALPTGLGKTFIASTVMLNFLRWFPDLKIIFMAPTRPLVAQQIKACCGITGIPSSKVAILLDKTRKNRASIWDSKQVFFTTPQVVENDLATGTVDPKLVVLLVIDEAHRAKGNYAYNNVVKFLNRFNLSYRILALTATPASDVEGVQEIVDNLCISKMEVRTEKSIDIFKYLMKKTVERIHVDQSPEIMEVIDLLCNAISPVLKTANQRKIYEVSDPRAINAFSALDAQQRIIKNPSIPEGLKWANFFILQLLIVVGQCLRRLNVYGIRSFYSYFHEKYTEFTTKHNKKKSTNQLAIKFYFHESVKELLEKCETLIVDPTFLGHRKLEITISKLETFFRNTANCDSRVIIFTEFRESALDIVRALENLGSMSKPHIFIGQAKEREKFDEEKFLKKGRKKKKDDTPEEKTKAVSKPERPMSSSEQAQVNGMNQKMQKELIKKFKAGDYNVLVATSIGEEGLDIGEVDLIVCYDSTSSPIKNIQRMGRTGRNRDGNVILLFSSNEELKFDKAMGGYEYIQAHIMSGNMISLHDQVRVIPDNITPVVHEQFIEIPDENLEIKEEEDEDEIIKIASKYMASKAPKSKKKAKGKDGKVQKRFFMPDDVDTGFKLVSMMLKKGNDNVSVGEKRRKVKDVLDSLLDPDDDVQHDKFPTEIQENIASESTKMSTDKTQSSPTDLTQLSLTKTIQSSPAKNTPNMVSPPKTLGLRRGFDNILRSSPRVLKQPILFDMATRPKLKASLGVKRRIPSVLEQLKCAPTVSRNESDFDNDDDEILALARTSSSFKEVQASVKQDKKESKESGLYPNNFLNQEGFLTKEQNDELYMSYYVPTEAYTLLNCYHVNVSGSQSALNGTTSKRYTKCFEFVKNIDSQQALELLEEYQLLSQEKQQPLENFIVFDK